MKDGLQTVPATLIVVGTNDRKTFKTEALAELAESIKANGLVQRPTVRPVVTNGVEQFEIVAGERRVRAMRDVLEWSDIPVNVVTMSDAEASAAMLVENVVRVDLNPIEEATAYAQRMALLDCSAADVATSIGVRVAHVRERLALLDLTESVQPLVASGDLPLRYAACMVRLDSNRQLLAIRAFLATESIGFPTFSALCNRLWSEQAQESLFDVNDFMRIEEYVQDALLYVVNSQPATADKADPVGQKDIAERLGVKRQTVGQWIQRGVFDLPPMWIVSGDPVWNWADVQAWADETGRGSVLKTGRGTK